MGDIHGSFKAMKQCFNRSAFDYRNDRLIQLGDVTDRHPQVFECVEELLKIEHLVSLKGNHDDWFCEFIRIDFHPYLWNHGGDGTLISYLDHAGKTGRYFYKGNGYKTGLDASDIPNTHQEFFKGQKAYYIDEQNRCFVHAGFKPNLAFELQQTEDLYCDRTLWQEALKQKENGNKLDLATEFKEIHIGHTPTTKTGTDRPMNAFHIHNLDTGAGDSGRLTIMDIDTKQYWQSDLVSELYGTSPQ